MAASSLRAPTNREGSLRSPLLLLAAFLVVAAATNWWIYRRNESTLDDALGRRLRTIASLLVVDTSIMDGNALYRPGGGLDRQYLASLEGLLEQIAADHNLDAVLLLEPTTWEVVYSSNPDLHPAGRGYSYLLTHQEGILEAIAENRSTASPTIRVGERGGVFLKSGFAPIYTVLQDELVAVLVVEASADFLGVLGELRRAMLSGMAVLGVLVVLLAALYVGMQRQTVKARQALERENRMSALGRMASQVAHEIRNPIGIIKYSAERMSRWLDVQQGGRRTEDPELLEMVAYIADETRRLQDITERYLTYARQGGPRLERQSPIELVASASEATGRMGLPEGIQVVVECEDAVPELIGDRNLLRQVLLNLTQNACEAMGRSGSLRLFARSGPSETVEIGVEDSGPGIPDRQKSRVFEAFYSTRAEGNGLGLFVVAQTARDHGGSAHIEDVPQGGTRVYVRLPAAQAGSAPRPAGSGEPPADEKGV